MQGSTFRMKYKGFRIRTHPEYVNRRQRVYKLKIIEIGATITESKPLYVAPDWAAEAETQPLVPARMTPGVPTQWVTTVPNDKLSLFINTEPYKIFMDQIGQPYKGRVDAL